MDNIVPACGPCNASKCNDEVTGWLRRKRLDERTFLARYLEITAGLGERFRAPTLLTGEPTAGAVPKPTAAGFGENDC